MPATLHRDSWDQYVAIVERDTAELKAEIERLRAALAEFNELRRLAADGRYSNELIGIRLRNYANQQQPPSRKDIVETTDGN